MPAEAASLEAGSLEAGSLEAGSLEAGSLEAGSLEAGSLEAGSADATPTSLLLGRVAREMWKWLQSLLGWSEPWDGMEGYPRSSNKASSFHAEWRLPNVAQITSVSAVFEVVTAPVASKLYFWALQVDFGGGGGAHIGLQHHPDYPFSCAVNWGGYAGPGEGGGELDGSPLSLPSALGNPNTCNYRWHAGRKYRLHVGRSPDAAPAGFVAWRGDIQDLETNERTIIRDLYGRGTALTRPMVWTEAFAMCNDPSVEVRWSELEVETEDGIVHSPTAIQLMYQQTSNGGCARTNTDVGGGTVVQRTNSVRTGTASVVQLDA